MAPLRVTLNVLHLHEIGAPAVPFLLGETWTSVRRIHFIACAVADARCTDARASRKTLSHRKKVTPSAG
ncbi:hypothetical protein [Xanthomonas axonopodis]|uniref:hypothetical protein n=1 Tax=Xanthomonas axonopodis TaxID=53413 RepID=UPI003557CD63